MNEQNTYRVILTSIAIVTLVLAIVGATYAYFAAQGGATETANIKVTSATTDTLTFSVGDAINVTANQSSFGSGMSSAADSTTATATLTANNSTNSATYNYNVYLDISDNDFEYTQDDTASYPELLLTVTGPSGAITTIDGLTYITVTDNQNKSISGFDVTTSSGVITIANKKVIVAGTSSTAASATTEEKWTITLTFVNYNKDQSANAGKSLNAKIKIQQAKNIISFTISSTTYYAEDGMTWEEWVNSTYNSESLLICSRRIGKGGMCGENTFIVTGDKSYCSGSSYYGNGYDCLTTDIIVSGSSYFWNLPGGSK